MKNELKDLKIAYAKDIKDGINEETIFKAIKEKDGYISLKMGSEMCVDKFVSYAKSVKKRQDKEVNDSLESIKSINLTDEDKIKLYKIYGKMSMNNFFKSLEEKDGKIYYEVKFELDINDLKNYLSGFEFDEYGRLYVITKK
jgi:hypothetical protein